MGDFGTLMSLRCAIGHLLASRSERPMLLIGSPMCTAFSTWQRINDKIRDPSVCAAEKARAVVHLEFSISLYREQLRNGRYFLHEHPAYATSWQEDAMKRLDGRELVLRLPCAISASMAPSRSMARQ